MSKLGPRALLLALPVALSPLAASPAAAADTTGWCEIPASIVCHMSDADGIARIVVKIPAPGGGTATVVDKLFDCPTEASVSWDPIVPGHTVTVYDCDTSDAPKSPDPGGTFTGTTVDSDGDGRADRVLLRPARR